MSVTSQELDEFFWRRGDLDVPYTDGERVDDDELRLWRLAHDTEAKS